MRGISQEMLPRNVYPGLSKPLLFAVFSKDQRRLLQGFAFYHETVETKQLDPEYAGLLTDAPVRPWKAVVAAAIENLGGKATLDQLYREIEGRRPTATNWWKEKVRQQCQRLGAPTHHLHGSVQRRQRAVPASPRRRRCRR